MTLMALLRGEGFQQTDQEATVELSSDTALLARLTVPLLFDGKEITHVVVQVRHEGEDFCDLRPGQKYFCNVTAIPTKRADAEDPLDLSWWRGGPAVITDMALF